MEAQSMEATSKNQTRLVQAMFLHNNKEQDVEVVEFEGVKLDVNKIQTHLKRGGSIFLTSKKKQMLPVPSLWPALAPQKK